MYYRSLQPPPYGNTKVNPQIYETQTTDGLLHPRSVLDMISSPSVKVPKTLKTKSSREQNLRNSRCSEISIRSWAKNAPEGFNLLTDAVITAIGCEICVTFFKIETKSKPKDTLKRYQMLGTTCKPLYTVKVFQTKKKLSEENIYHSIRHIGRYR